MNLGEIERLAWQTLDEDPEELDAQEELLRSYCNQGYYRAVTEYLRPKEVIALEPDAHGLCQLEDRVTRVVSVTGGLGNPMRTMPTQHGHGLQLLTRLGRDGAQAVCEVKLPPLSKLTDEPQIPEAVQPALADYICYRLLTGGDLTMQKRAQAFYLLYEQQMETIRPVGQGSTWRFTGLREATC